MAVLAKEIMTAPAVSIKGDTSLKKAAEILDDNSFSGLPVVDDSNKLIGIVSEADILRYTQQIIGQPLRDPHRVFTKGREVLHVDITHRGVEVIELVASTNVEAMMTFDVVSAAEDTPVYEVVRMMQDHNINRIPVVDGNNCLKGIITRADIIKAMVDRWKTINRD